MSRLKTIGKRNISTLDTRRGSSVGEKRITGRPLTRIRERVMLRDEYTCQVCGRVTRRLVIDHRIPLHLGGKESDENRQSLCIPCHDIKSKEECTMRA